MGCAVHLARLAKLPTGLYISMYFNGGVHTLCYQRSPSHPIPACVRIHHNTIERSVLGGDAGCRQHYSMTVMTVCDEHFTEYVVSGV